MVKYYFYTLFRSLNIFNIRRRYTQNTFLFLFVLCRALENLINFAYSGTVKIDNQNVQSLMVGASFLQLSKVRDACADFLISR